MSASLFAEYATSTAFVLTLSKGQMQMLLALRYKDEGVLSGWRQWIRTFAALEERGLVERSNEKLPPNSDPYWIRQYGLTNAGRLVAALVDLIAVEKPELLILKPSAVQPHRVGKDSRFKFEVKGDLA